METTFLAASSWGQLEIDTLSGKVLKVSCSHADENDKDNYLATIDRLDVERYRRAFLKDPQGTIDILAFGFWTKSGEYESPADDYEVQTFYLTFGQAHRHHETNEPMRDYYIEVKAQNRQAAEKWAFATFRYKWANLVPPKRFDRDFYPKGRYGDVIWVPNELSACANLIPNWHQI